MKPILLLVVNDPAFFLSHRLAVAIGAKEAGYNVHIATKAGDAATEIRSYGFHHHVLPLSRSGKNPLTELRLLISMLRLFWRLRPDVLHLVTIKPVLYGGIAARLAPVRSVVAAISGLGFVYMAKGLKAQLLRGLVTRLYRLALCKRNLKVIFQNAEDCLSLLRFGAVTPSRTVIIRGSGVDLSLCRPLPESTGIPVVTFAARLLRDKGIVEFVEAAYLLRQRGVQVRFQLAGDIDLGNPTSITSLELDRWRSEGIIEYLGYRKDIPHIFAQCNIVVLPSYREGLPKVLIEAAACGRAVVTTDVPGCRDAIEANVTGLLVPVRDVDALADAIQKLIADPELRQRMGRAGRKLAEREFDIEGIVRQHLSIYCELRDVA